MSGDSNGWDTYSKLVMTKIEELSGGQGDLRKEINKFKIDMTKELGKVTSEISMLKLKASIWGGIWGTVVSILVPFILRLLTQKS